MGIEVRHSPNVNLAGNVAAQAGAGRAKREDEQQARAAAERRAAQEAQIQAQYERDLLQAEIQAQRDQDMSERAKEMDDKNFQQQKELFGMQGTQRANEAEAAFDRQLETIDYTYTAKEKAENERIQNKIEWVENNPRYTRKDKDEMIAKLQGIKKPPTGAPDSFADEVKSSRWIETLPNGEQILYVKGANGLEYRPLKQPEQKTDSGKLRFDVQKARAAHVARLLAIRDTDNNPRYTEEQATADAEKRFPMSGGSASKVTPTREQQEARALAESFGVQFQGEMPADLSAPEAVNAAQAQGELQNEASSAARAPLGLKAEDLQAEYSKALRQSFATAKQAGVSPAEAEQVSEEHKAELMGLIRQSLLAEAQKYGQIGNAPPQERARLMKLRSLLELWKGAVRTSAPTRGVKPPAPPQGEFE